MSSRSDILYLLDIRESVEAIFQYTKDISFTDFVHDRMRYSAVVREFEIIGEAVGKLTDIIKDKYPEVSWQDIKDFRNLLTHEYFGVDLEIVWNVIRNDLPALYETLGKMEAELANSG
jgi:uncharacterized protein with HEPN domain